VNEIACGGYQTCAYAASGGLYCWGANKKGQLGVGNNKRSMPSPTLVTSMGYWMTVGKFHACFVSAGQVMCMGSNNNGELGDGMCFCSWWGAYCEYRIRLYRTR
jgi:hypothetical protein